MSKQTHITQTEIVGKLTRGKCLCGWKTDAIPHLQANVACWVHLTRKNVLEKI